MNFTLTKITMLLLILLCGLNVFKDAINEDYLNQYGIIQTVLFCVSLGLAVAQFFVSY